MPCKITYSKRFEKNYRAFNLNERAQIERKIELLVNDPFHPSLRTKKLKGTDDLFESSANMDIRIVWYYENGEVIMLVDVGHHDILKQF